MFQNIVNVSLIGVLQLIFLPSRGEVRRGLIKIKVSAGIIVRDVFNHADKCFLVVREKALFNVVSENVAEQSSEILMTRIAQERTAICEHTYKTTQQSKNREGIHLACHTV